MPELPDLTVYREHIERRIVGERLQRVTVAIPSLLKTCDPPVTELHGHVVRSIRLIGKRIALRFEPDLYLVLHLMIAGRLKWRGGVAKVAIPRKVGLASFSFAPGALLLTEQGSKRRASLCVVRRDAALQGFDRGGIDPLAADLVAFSAALAGENHTVKRSLTDPRLFFSIGNAYSDEILHAACVSPLKWTQWLTDNQVVRLHAATGDVLSTWVERLRNQAGDGFPKKVTAVHPDMAVHGRYAEPCPRCDTPVQRIVYADNECNYCPRCQTGGKLLADRALSRLLKGDWPRSLQELDELRTPRQ